MPLHLEESIDDSSAEGEDARELLCSGVREAPHGPAVPKSWKSRSWLAERLRCFVPDTFSEIANGISEEL